MGKMWCDQEIVWNEDPFSAKTLQHFLQNGIEGRFQEFANEYTSGGKGGRITADIPINEIKKTPIAVFYGDADKVCPLD